MERHCQGYLILPLTLDLWSSSENNKTHTFPAPSLQQDEGTPSRGTPCHGYDDGHTIIRISAA